MKHFMKNCSVNHCLQHPVNVEQLIKLFMLHTKMVQCTVLSVKKNYNAAVFSLCQRAITTAGHHPIPNMKFNQTSELVQGQFDITGLWQLPFIVI